MPCFAEIQYETDAHGGWENTCFEKEEAGGPRQTRGGLAEWNGKNAEEVLLMEKLN